MPKDTYTRSMSIDDIIYSLERSLGLDGNIIWQSRNSTKYVNHIKFMDYNEESKEINIEVKEKLLDFDINETTFIKLSFRGTIFKVEIKEFDQNSITLKIPQVVMAVENRKSPRYRFELVENRMASIELIEENKSDDRSVSFRVLDVSLTGICLFVTDGYVDQIRMAKKILLEKFGNNYLSDSPELVLIYSQEFKIILPSGKTEGYKIGFLFRKPILKSTFDHMIYDS